MSDLIERPTRRARVLVAKLGLDGHDRGAKVVAHALRDAGMEVIYTGLRRNAREVVAMAIDEDVDVIGLSVLSGAHVALAQQVLDQLAARGVAGEIPIVVGGTISVSDAEVLRGMGIGEVFGVRTPLEELAPACPGAGRCRSRSAMSELEPGAKIRGNSRTITDAEVAFLPALMGAINPLFHDEETAKAGKLGRRVLYGPALLGIAVAGTEYLLKDVVLGLLGMTDVKFRSPVGVGDTVTPTLIVEDRIAKPDKAGDLLLVRDEVHNQAGVLVLEFRRTIMVKRA